jgi:tetratricopeptide (TPR) repeat protein
VSECDNVSALRNIIRPSVPAAELEAMRARLARLQAFRFISSVRTQGDEARSLAAAARRAGALDIAAGAVTIEAAVARANADLAASADYYREAAMLAGMAHDDTSLVRILISAASLEGPIRANFKSAFELIDYATPVAERLGGNAYARWNVMRVRGEVENRADRFKDAEEHYRQALAWLERIGNDPIDRAQLLLDLADCVGDQGRFDESLPLYREALAFYRATLGDDHIQTLTLRNNLALDVYESGKVAEAAELERGVVAGYEKRTDVLGLANALWTLGLFVEPNNLDEAEALYRRSLALYEKSVGRDLVDICYPLTGLGRVALARGRAAEAVPFLERALALQSAPELRDTPDRAETELALAKALARGPRALALATHARDVLQARPSGPTRAALVRQAEELVTRLR